MLWSTTPAASAAALKYWLHVLRFVVLKVVSPGSSSSSSAAASTVKALKSKKLTKRQVMEGHVFSFQDVTRLEFIENLMQEFELGRVVQIPRAVLSAYDEGRYPLRLRWNADSIPFNFDFQQLRTYVHADDKQVQVSGSVAGDKRMGTIHMLTHGVPAQVC